MLKSKIKNRAAAFSFLFIALTIFSAVKLHNEYYAYTHFLDTPDQSDIELVLTENPKTPSEFAVFISGQFTFQQLSHSKYYSSKLNEFYVFQFNLSQLLILKNQPAENKCRNIYFEQIQSVVNYSNNIDDSFQLS